MFQIDNQSPVPIYEQIIEQIERQVLMGLLEPDAQIPSVRSMSLEMHLNPNTVQRAYGELDRRRVIYTHVGKGTFIAKAAAENIRKDRRQRLDGLKMTLWELALSGIEKEEILSLIESIYKEEQAL